MKLEILGIEVNVENWREELLVMCINAELSLLAEDIAEKDLELEDIYEEIQYIRGLISSLYFMFRIEATVSSMEIYTKCRGRAK